MKTFLFLPVLLMAVLFTGCTKKYEYVTPNQTIFFDVDSGDWTKASDGKSYLVDLPIPEIDGQVNQNFGILVSISGDGGLYEAIPETYGGYAYSYTHEVGHLTLARQYVDGSASGPQPEANIRVKIVLVESQQ
ncbi:MAG TPA: hypothetical protein VGE79_10060 [Niastella sp.]|jgi:hypothetical protein